MKNFLWATNVFALLTLLASLASAQQPRPARPTPARPDPALRLPEVPPNTSLCDLAPGSPVIFPQDVRIEAGSDEKCEHTGLIACCIKLPHQIHTQFQAGSPQEHLYQRDRVRIIQAGTLRVTSSREGCEERRNTIWIRTPGNHEIYLECTRNSVGPLLTGQAHQFFGGLSFRGTPLPPRPAGSVNIRKPEDVSGPGIKAE